MLKNGFVVFFVMLFSTSLLAHEGHKEATLKSMYGGVVKKTTNTFIEAVQEGNEVQLYIRDHDDKIIPQTDLQITGEIKDSKKKVEAIKVEAIAGKFYKVKNDTSKHPFFSVVVIVSGKVKTGKFSNEKVVFNLENSME